jgi:hypothetical protein
MGNPPPIPDGMILIQRMLIVCAGDPFQSPEFTVEYVAAGGTQGTQRVLGDLTETELGYVEEAGNALLSSIGAIRIARKDADLGLDDYDEKGE